MDVGNAEAAPTPPPQLPTPHASNFQVPVFFFLFEICEVSGTIGFSQI